MSRAHFWLWIGTLEVATALIMRTGPLFVFGKEGVGPSLQAVIDRYEFLKQGLNWVGRSWPNGLAIAPLPFASFDSGNIFIFATWPLLLLIHMLTIGPAAQRACDAGYSPVNTLILLYWSVIGPVVLLPINLALFGFGGLAAIPPFYLTLGYFGYVAPTASFLAALVAIFILTSPSKHGPIPSEAHP